MLTPNSPSTLLGRLRLRENPAFLILSIALVGFFGMALYEHIFQPNLGLILSFLVMGGALVRGLLLFADRVQPASVSYSPTGVFNLVLSTAAGAVLTYLISVNLGAGPFIASALVGLIPGLLLLVLLRNDKHRRFADLPAAIYCGSFVGMTSSAVFPSVGGALLAGLIAGMLYLIGLTVFAGAGGKFGTVAFIAVTITAFASGYRPAVASGPPASSLPLTRALLTIAVCMAGATLTYLVNHRLKTGPVVASALVSLAAALVFALPGWADPALMRTLSAGVMGASFAGMAGPNVIAHEGRMLIAGLFFGLIFINSAAFFTGFGGGLGTTACLSVVMTSGLIAISEADRRTSPTYPRFRASTR